MRFESLLFRFRHQHLLNVFGGTYFLLWIRYYEFSSELIYFSPYSIKMMGRQIISYYIIVCHDKKRTYTKVLIIAISFRISLHFTEKVLIFKVSINQKCVEVEDHIHRPKSVVIRQWNSTYSCFRVFPQGHSTRGSLFLVLFHLKQDLVQEFLSQVAIIAWMYSVK